MLTLKNHAMSRIIKEQFGQNCITWAQSLASMLQTLSEIGAMNVTVWCIWGKLSSGKEDCRQHPVSHYKKKKNTLHAWGSQACVWEQKANHKHMQIYSNTINCIYHVNYLNRYRLCTSANCWLCTFKCQSFSFFKEMHWNLKEKCLLNKLMWVVLVYLHQEQCTVGNSTAFVKVWHACIVRYTF